MYAIITLENLDTPVLATINGAINEHNYFHNMGVSKEQNMFLAGTKMAFLKADNNALPFECKYGKIESAEVVPFDGFDAVKVGDKLIADVTFKQKDLAKAEGFRWNGGLQVWSKPL